MSIGAQRILVVDDERVIADTLAIIFRRAGYDTRVAYDGVEALKVARGFAPHLVVSDVVMPGPDGIESAISIERECQGTKVLLFSGQARSAGLLERARLAGYSYPLLSKPMPPDDLLKHVADLLASKAAAAAPIPGADHKG